MISRLLTKADLEQFSQVSSTAYIHDAAETEFNETKDIFGTFIDDGTLISQIECSFKTCWYGEVPIKCAAVGGVASRPDYRRLGGVRATFDAVFKNALQKDCAVSILYPFSIGYYRQFGYEPIFRYIKADCSFKAFEKISRTAEFTLLTEKHKAEIEEIYTKIAQNSNMMFARDNAEGFCMTPYNSLKHTYFVNNGDSAGYVFVSPDRPSKTIIVNEICFTDKKALTELLGVLRTYDGNYDTVVFDKLPLSSPVLGMLADENTLIKRTLLYGGAGRILDMEKVLKANRYPQSYGKFTLKITDNQIKANNAVFTVEYENGNCTISKNTQTEFDIALDIAAASRILLGRDGLSLDEISYLPDTEIKNACEDFIRAFPKRTTQFYDGF